jgi:hypothetical protein
MGGTALLPSSQDGILMLKDRRVSEGQSIRRRELGDLAFIPTDKTVNESEFYFSLDRGSEAKILCRMRFLDRINYAPSVNDKSEDSPCVTTQNGISVYGKLTATDPEGDALIYSVIKYPRYGTLKINEDGEFAYTPTDEELQSLGIDRYDIGDAKFYYGKGCAICNNTGYKSRKAITELLEVTPDIKELIYQNAPTAAIRERARELGMRTIREDGLMAILKGETTVDEVLRYTR